MRRVRRTAGIAVLGVALFAAAAPQLAAGIKRVPVGEKQALKPEESRYGGTRKKSPKRIRIQRVDPKPAAIVRGASSRAQPSLVTPSASKLPMAIAPAGKGEPELGEAQRSEASQGTVLRASEQANRLSGHGQDAPVLGAERSQEVPVRKASSEADPARPAGSDREARRAE